MVEIEAQDCRLLIQDGASPRFYEEGKAPSKHQLFVEFDDGTALACSVQMYGGIWAFHEGKTTILITSLHWKNRLPLSEAFRFSLISLSLRDEDSGRLSAKAFLATKQRIPGLGNGTLQDILLPAASIRSGRWRKYPGQNTAVCMMR